MGIDEAGHFRGMLKSTGLRPKFLDKLTDQGIQLDPNMFAFEKFAR
jgi:pilus assembly protein CpaF